MTTLKPWEPNAVLIPEDAAWKNGAGETTVDHELCTLLMLEGDRLSGELFTKEEWEAGMRPVYTLHDDKYWKVVNGEEQEFCRAGLSIKDQEPVAFPRIQLLPEMWVLKVEETEYWNLDDLPDIRVFGVYVLNKKKAVYLCEITPSYELSRFNSQWEWHNEAMADDPSHDELVDKVNSAIFNAEDGDDLYSYVHCSDVEKQLQAETLTRGALPKGKSGGYRLKVDAVTEEDALEEIREDVCNGVL